VFLHPRITPDFIKTQRLLAGLQGTTGVWFAGSYTGEVDSQETALLSAMNVVESWLPKRRIFSRCNPDWRRSPPTVVLPSIRA
jgi:predicted NAD/FAD-binding protein